MTAPIPGADVAEPCVAATETIGRGVFWCKCGRSFARPFCDGTHQGACACRNDLEDARISARTSV